MFLLYEGERHSIKILNIEHYVPLYIILNRLEVQRRASSMKPTL